MIAHSLAMNIMHDSDVEYFYCIITNLILVGTYQFMLYSRGGDSFFTPIGYLSYLSQVVHSYQVKHLPGIFGQAIVLP